jgi:hypothetical protein
MRKSFLKRPETAVDIFKLLPEGVHCQVMDNAIYISPSPSFDHQAIISAIHYAVKDFLKNKKQGKCVAAFILSFSTAIFIF